MAYQGTQLVRIGANGNEVRDSKAGGKLHNIIKKPPIASTSPITFGDNRMGNACRGLLERQSLEASCLVAEGEDNSLSYEAVPGFTRPMPAGRQRSSTQSSCTTSSKSPSGVDTPPLSPSNGSMSGGSMSSIDLLDLGSMLVNTTNPNLQPRCSFMQLSCSHLGQYFGFIPGTVAATLDQKPPRRQRLQPDAAACGCRSLN
ncbi:hypothetical protein BKA70DRAFT_388692 [Coprinopsis sp. MPI-PUGE-AT-0042]|nr:hypothetical protein BKA70DRAFT_388692 [Coprinopsis sp. MPI-PUGE-AT-0042]